MTYGIEQVRDVLIAAAQGTRPEESWLRDIEDAEPIEGEVGTFGITIAGEQFFVTIEPA